MWRALIGCRDAGAKHASIQTDTVDDEIAAWHKPVLRDRNFVGCALSFKSDSHSRHTLGLSTLGGLKRPGDRNLYEGEGDIHLTSDIYPSNSLYKHYGITSTIQGRR